MHNVVDRGVELQAMWEELAGKLGHRDLLNTHIILKTLY